MRSVRDEVRRATGTVPSVDDRVWARADDAEVGVASDRVWWPIRNEVKDNA